MRSLFLVTLGPVQDFIASARRTRDLHFGSWLLSELSRVAACEINAQKVYLIFPAPENMAWLQPMESFNVANRILALIEQEPVELAMHIQTAISRRLHQIRDGAYGGIELPDKQKANAYAQIDDLVELAWVSLPLPDERKYHMVRSQLEALMAARKNTHPFAPVTWGESVPKSSLDGQLESVIPVCEYPQSNASVADKRLALESLYRRYKLAGLGERLSGVDLLKRLGRTVSGTHFPSTSHFAVFPFLQCMMCIDAGGVQALRAAWNTYITHLDTLTAIPLKEQLNYSYPAHRILGCYDGSLLLEERLVDMLLLPSTDVMNNEKFQQAREAQQAFYCSLDKEFRRAGLSKARPSTYYALLQADGDNMGDLIDALAEHGYERHRELSRALSRFAESVRGIVVDHHQGALVYSGGDDVLAFLPLHTALACAVKLKTRFHDALKDLAAQVGCRPPTLSVGIAIVHHLDSLRKARYLAHDAEKRAKHQDGKNALAITVSKRSGEEYRAVGSWDNIDVRLSQLVDYCRDASIPAGMAYELRDLVLRLSVPKTDPRYNALQQVIRVDTLRILLRKLTVPAGKLPQERVKETEAFLRVQLGLPPKEEEQLCTPQHAIMACPERCSLPPVSIEMFINELVIAQMLAEAAELAQVEKGAML